MGWLKPEVGREVAGSPADMRLAGSIRPQGRARRVEGGYRIEGRWNFASGVQPRDLAECVGRRGVSLVLGDSVDDRLIFWNGFHGAAGVGLAEVASLRIPAARVGDRDLLNRVGAIIQQRGNRASQGQTIATLRSRSLSQEQLETIAADIRGALGRVPFSVAHYESHAVCVPETRDADRGSGSVQTLMSGRSFD